jgi:hypothetical protein
MFTNVMPKRSAYFELLASHTDRVVAGANATMRLISGLGQPNADSLALIDEVFVNEASADKIRDDLIRLLFESFTTPINRDQLHTLALDLDRVIDDLQHVANAVAAYRIGEATGEARAMASLTADACLRLNRAVVSLADKARDQETVDLCNKIDKLDAEAGKLRRKAIKRMFEEEGDDAAVWNAIKMRELYLLLDTVLDSCKRAAKTIEEILIENS